MKTITNFIIALALSGAAFAQTTALNQTTLTAAISSPAQTQIAVASTTGMAAYAPLSGGWTELYVDKEAMLVNTINGSVVNVIRGVDTTGAGQHASGAIVWVGPPNAFDQATSVGTCTAASWAFTPKINVKTGDVQVCGSLGFWAKNNLGFGVLDWGIGAYTAVADAAYTVKVTDSVVAYQTLTAARTVTLPSAVGLAGHVFVIKDEAGTAGTSNITVSGSIDGGASKVLSANYGIVKVYSNGTAYFSF